MSESLDDPVVDLILTKPRYSIRVGRSKSPRGPFLDKTGKDLVDGGGTLIYGSNGDTYAPGGQSVIRIDDTDVLYYHYCKAPSARPIIKQTTDVFAVNKTVGISFSVSSHLGRLVDRDSHHTLVDPPSFPFRARHHDIRI